MAADTPLPATPEAAVLVAIARIDGKLDAYASALDRHREVDDDHEQRLRNMEAALVEDGEDRVRALEREPRVSPRQVYAAATLAVAAAGVLASVLPL